jgi:hypothetical protein
MVQMQMNQSSHLEDVEIKFLRHVRTAKAQYTASKQKEQPSLQQKSAQKPKNLHQYLLTDFKLVIQNVILI